MGATVDSELAAMLHRDQHVVRAEKHLFDMIQGIIGRGSGSGSSAR